MPVRLADLQRLLLGSNQGCDYLASPERVACLGEIFRDNAYSFERFVERASFLPTGGQQWRRDLQLKIPSGVGAASARQAWWIVPLGQFKRRRLVDIAVEDAGGRRLNLLTRRQHGEALAHLVISTHVAGIPQTAALDRESVRELTRPFCESLERFFTAPSGSSTDHDQDMIGLSLDLKGKYRELLAHLPLATIEIGKRVDAFNFDLKSWIDRTQYLCWASAILGDVLNLRVSYTVGDPNHELNIGSAPDALRSVRAGLWPFSEEETRSQRVGWFHRGFIRSQLRPFIEGKARQHRANWFRQFGLTPIEYKFKVPAKPTPASYYFAIEPPPHTSVSYLDWGSGHYFQNAHSSDEPLEVNCAYPAAHVYSSPSGQPAEPNSVNIRAYIRCAPFRHKQILGAAALNFVVVWLLAKGRLPADLTEPLQGFVIAAPSVMIGFLAQQQRHYYSRIMSRQRALLWFYLILSVTFLVAVAFNERDRVSGLSWETEVAGFALATFSAGIFGWHVLLGGSYERAVRWKAKRRYRKANGTTEMWLCYSDAVRGYAVTSWWTTVGLMVLAVLSLLVWWGGASQGSAAIDEAPASHVSLHVNGIQIQLPGGSKVSRRPGQPSPKHPTPTGNGQESRGPLVPPRSP